MSALIQDLAERIREIEAPRHRHATLALGIPALDGIVPEDGLPAGALVELLSAADGAGTWTLGLLVARQAAGARRALVIVDPGGCFYPPAAAAWGVDLRRMIVVRPTKLREVYVAANLALRCAAVGVVMIWCERLSSLEFRRLQLSAEAGGGIGVLLRGAAALRSPSFAALRLLVRPVPATGPCPRLQIEVVVARGLAATAAKPRVATLEIDDETHDVRVPAELVAAASRARTDRAAQ